MPTCPAGHDSTDEEFCDVCGREMGGAAPAAAAPVSAPAAAPAPDVPPEGATCPACGAPLAGRFCEACGQDSLAAPPAAVVTPAVTATEPTAPADQLPDNATWTATVSADRAYFDSVMAAEGPDAPGIRFPPYCPDRHFPLQGKQVSIGRQSRSRGIAPDIDLIGPPEDPGVSHLHALLVAQDDGSWSVVDLDSANGTTVNDEPRPLSPNAPRALTEGDRVFLGAWTKITMRRA